MKFGFIVCACATALSLFAQTVVEPRIDSETLPSGGLMQIKLGTTSPNPIIIGTGRFFDMDAAFDGIEGVSIFSPAGDAYGVAFLRGRQFIGNFVSPQSSLGTQLDYPFLVVASKIRPGISAGTRIPINISGEMVLRAPDGTPYSIPAPKHGVLTIGGSISVTNVIPGGGVWPAGTVIRILGTGFTSRTRVDINEVLTSTIQIVSSTEIRATLAQSADMTGRRIRLRNDVDDHEVFYYSYLRPVPVGASSRPLLVSAHAVFNSQNHSSTAVTIPASPANGFVALAIQNIGTATSQVQLQLVSPSGAVVGGAAISLPSGSIHSRTLQELFAVSPPVNSSVRVTATPPVQVLGLVGDEATGNLTAFLPGAAPPVTPQLTVSPASLSFNYQVNGAIPATQPLTLGATSGTLAYNATANANWLSASPASGQAPGTMSVAVNPAGLTPGQHTANLTLTPPAGSTPVVVPVTLNVTAAPVTSQLTLSPSSLAFTFQTGGAVPAARTVNVGATAGALSFSATSTTSWLGVTSSSAQTPAILTVSVNPTGLAAGTYNGSISVTPQAGSTPQSIPVTLNVTAAPVTSQLTLSPSSLAFTFQTGGAVPAARTVNVGATAGALSFSATSTTSWLGVTSSSAQTPAILTVSANPTGLAAGTYNGSISVTPQAGSTPQSIPVTLNVTAAPVTSQLTLSPASLVIDFQLGSPVPTPRIVNVGATGAALSFGATSTVTWLNVTSSSGQTPATLSITANPTGLAAGTYNGSISVTPQAGSTPQSIPVTLNVTAAPVTSQLTLSQTSLTFDYVSGGLAAPTPRSVSVGATSGILSFSASSNATWLNVTASGPQTPATLEISINPARLAAGTYNGVISVTPQSGATPQAISVTLNLSTAPAAPRLTVSPTSFVFDFQLGGAAPLARTVNVTATTGALSVNATSNASWLSVTSSSAQTPALLNVSVNPVGLPAGTYSGSITIAAAPGADAPLIAVTLNVTAATAIPQLSVAQSSLAFEYQSGGATPGSRGVNVAATSGLLSFSAASDSPWLTVSPASASTPAILTVSVSPASLAPGTYTGQVVLRTISGAETRLPVTLQVTATAQPAPSIASLVGAANQSASSGIAPGQIVTIYGSSLGPVTPVNLRLLSPAMVDAFGGPTRVWFGSTPAPILYASQTQVNAIVPYEVAGARDVQVQVEYQGLRSTARSLAVSPAAPSIFTQNSSGSGPASVLNQDFSVNTAQRPAPRGSVIMIYATGAGQTSPGCVTGEVAGELLKSTQLPVTVILGGRRIAPLYAGTAPGLVSGVLQVNVLIPGDLAPASAIPLAVEIGGVLSTAGPVISVQ